MSKKHFVWALVFVMSLAVLTGCQEAMRKSAAEGRVTAMLEGWQRSGGRPTREEQTATCLFYEGVVMINDRPTLEKAVDKFAEFKNAKNLYRAIESFEVVSSTAEGEDVLVEVKIDGDYYTMRVRASEPITWAD